MSSRPRELLGLLIVLAILTLAFGVGTGRFLTVTTFRTIANQIPEAVIAAVGLTYVLVIAGIDLSVGSILALSSAVLGVTLVRYGLPLPLAVLAALITGGLCGGLNGLLVVRWQVPSFIATLGMLEMARGATYLVTRSETQYVGERVEGLASASVLGLSIPFLAALVLVALAEFVLTRTVFGRYMVAVGTNEEALRLAGVDPRPLKLVVFVLSGLLAALAGVVYTSRLASADPNAGVGFELSSIAAVVVGGTSLMGGRGSVVGSLLGVLIIAVLGSGLAQAGAQEPTKRLVTGAVIIAAVLADHYRRARHQASA
jgi:ribose transport system permease protein